MLKLKQQTFWKIIVSCLLSITIYSNITIGDTSVTPSIEATIDLEFNQLNNTLVSMVKDSNNLRKDGPKIFKVIVDWLQQNHKKRLNDWKNAADKDHANSQFFLGIYSLIIKNDKKAADEWLTKSAQNGNAWSQLGIGLRRSSRLRKGLTEEGFQLIYKSAQQGNILAQYIVSIFFATGKGTKQDMDTAKKWLKKSANQGFKAAQRLVNKPDLKPRDFYMSPR